jgi:hypothetical protein
MLKRSEKELTSIMDYGIVLMLEMNIAFPSRSIRFSPAA